MGYDIAVKNVGDAATVGQVSVTDTLPAGLTITGASGTGWACYDEPAENLHLHALRRPRPRLRATR